MRYRSFITLFLFTPLVLALASASYAQTNPKRILIVFSGDNKAPGAVAFVDQVRAVVRDGLGDDAEFYEELLDSERFPDRWPRQVAYIVDKYRTVHLDAIVAQGALGLRVVAEHLHPHFPQVPVVYGQMFEPIVDLAALGPNITGTRLEFSFGATFDLARRLQPDAERVVLVSGRAPLDSVLLKLAVRDIKPMLGERKLVVLDNWSYDSLLLALHALPRRSIVILGAFTEDTRGRRFNPGDLIPAITRATSAPTYGVARNWVGDGIVGGSVLDFRANGTQTGRMLMRVLKRAPGVPLPAPEVADAPIVVDWRELRHWRLSERALPTGTEVLYKTPNAWQRYRTIILIALSVLLAQAVLIALLLVERARRRRVQARLMEQNAYEQMMAELRVATVRISPVQISAACTAALTSIGKYARADTAVLHITGIGNVLPSTRVVWPDNEEKTSNSKGASVELPLIANGTTLGTLELAKRSTASWSPEVVARVRSASDLLAGAVARAQDAYAMEETRNQMAHMARVVTMGQLAAAVSHELRQPLSAIRLNAETGLMLLNETAPDVNVTKEIFQDILSDGVRATQVIEQLRVLFRKEASTAALVDLNNVCRQTVRLVKPEANLRGVELEVLLAADLPRILGDVVQLQQVVLNLVLNALDATADTETPRVVVATSTRENVVELSVQDTGAGLSREAQQRLFESFFSSKQDGLGIGLSIVRSIVERHGGRVCGENVAEGGARFTVVLPVEKSTPIMQPS